MVSISRARTPTPSTGHMPARLTVMSLKTAARTQWWVITSIALIPTTQSWAPVSAPPVITNTETPPPLQRRHLRHGDMTTIGRAPLCPSTNLSMRSTVMSTDSKTREANSRPPRRILPASKLHSSRHPKTSRRLTKLQARPRPWSSKSSRQQTNHRQVSNH